MSAPEKIAEVLRDPQTPFAPWALTIKIVVKTIVTAFSVISWWNELPSTTRAGVSLSTFKKLLKTQLFREHFPS